MTLSTKQTYRADFGRREGVERWIGSLGLADANSYCTKWMQKIWKGMYTYV